MNIILTKRAKQDLNNIFEYNLNISLNYAIRIEKKIIQYIEKLRDFPNIGRYVPEIPDRHYRERICEKYRIIYYIFEKYNTIYIRFVFNAKKDKTAFFEIHKNQTLNFFNDLFS